MASLSVFAVCDDAAAPRLDLSLGFGAGPWARVTVVGPPPADWARHFETWLTAAKIACEAASLPLSPPGALVRVDVSGPGLADATAMHLAAPEARVPEVVRAALCVAVNAVFYGDPDLAPQCDWDTTNWLAAELMPAKGARAPQTDLNRQAPGAFGAGGQTLVTPEALRAASASRDPGARDPGLRASPARAPGAVVSVQALAAQEPRALAPEPRAPEPRAPGFAPAFASAPAPAPASAPAPAAAKPAPAPAAAKPAPAPPDARHAAWVGQLASTTRQYISSYGAAPDFTASSMAAKLKAHNYIRSVCSMQSKEALPDEVVEAVRARLAAGA